MAVNKLSTTSTFPFPVRLWYEHHNHMVFEKEGDPSLPFLCERFEGKKIDIELAEAMDWDVRVCDLDSDQFQRLWHDRHRVPLVRRDIGDGFYMVFRFRDRKPR